MSKISQLHAELSSQAYDLGFNSLEDALAMGYEVDYENSKLVDGREQAHKAWLEEKQNRIKTLTEMLMDLRELKETLDPTDFTKWATTIKDTIEFIEKGEM